MNEKFAHTPGPWVTSISDLLYGEVCVVYGGSEMRYIGVNDRPDSPDEWDAQVDANAQAIATVPEMLAALKQAIAALETCNPGDYSTGHVIHASFDEAACDAALIACTEAYSKATGKTSEAA